jgi:hypothetical protein
MDLVRSCRPRRHRRCLGVRDLAGPIQTRQAALSLSDSDISRNIPEARARWSLTESACQRVCFTSPACGGSIGRHRRPFLDKTPKLSFGYGALGSAIARQSAAGGGSLSTRPARFADPPPPQPSPASGRGSGLRSSPQTRSLGDVSALRYRPRWPPEPATPGHSAGRLQSRLRWRHGFAPTSRRRPPSILRRKIGQRCKKHGARSADAQLPRPAAPTL